MSKVKPYSHPPKGTRLLVLVEMVKREDDRLMHLSSVKIIIKTSVRNVVQLHLHMSWSPLLSLLSTLCRHAIPSVHQNKFLKKKNDEEEYSVVAVVDLTFS